MALTKTTVAMLEASGTPSSSNFLRGDGSWSAPASGITAMTAVASTSGTAIDFTSIPAGVKRVTFMFHGISTNASSNFQVQLGTSSGFTTTGYIQFSGWMNAASSVGNSSATSGFQIPNWAAAATHSGSLTFSNLTGNTWVCQGTNASANGGGYISGSIALGGVLDRVRITTGTGTDVFDAGSINVSYE